MRREVPWARALSLRGKNPDACFSGASPRGKQAPPFLVVVFFRVHGLRLIRLRRPLPSCGRLIPACQPAAGTPNAARLANRVPRQPRAALESVAAPPEGLSASLQRAPACSHPTPSTQRALSQVLVQTLQHLTERPVDGEPLQHRPPRQDDGCVSNPWPQRQAVTGHARRTRRPRRTRRSTSAQSCSPCLAQLRSRCTQSSVAHKAGCTRRRSRRAHAVSQQQHQRARRLPCSLATAQERVHSAAFAGGLHLHCPALSWRRLMSSAQRVCAPHPPPARATSMLGAAARRVARCASSSLCRAVAAQPRAFPTAAEAVRAAAGLHGPQGPQGHRLISRLGRAASAASAPPTTADDALRLYNTLSRQKEVFTPRADQVSQPGPSPCAKPTASAKRLKRFANRATRCRCTSAA